mmetsp:Transcript_24915/g.47150  ORF Transcript_24915/g.47150 Transcript_24915/m.47150 type:complete len:262 (-) Transcript_24915:1054-1839(-)
MVSGCSGAPAGGRAILRGVLLAAGHGHGAGLVLRHEVASHRMDHGAPRDVGRPRRAAGRSGVVRARRGRGAPELEGRCQVVPTRRGPGPSCSGVRAGAVLLQRRGRQAGPQAGRPALPAGGGQGPPRGDVRPRDLLRHRAGNAQERDKGLGADEAGGGAGPARGPVLLRQGVRDWRRGRPADGGGCALAHQSSQQRAHGGQVQHGRALQRGRRRQDEPRAGGPVVPLRGGGRPRRCGGELGLLLRSGHGSRARPPPVRPVV